MKNLIRRKWMTIGFYPLLIAATLPLFYWASLAFYPYIEGFKRLGYLGVFLAALLTASTAFVPTPVGPASFSLAVVVASFLNPYLTVLVYGFGGALGEGTSYLLGLSGRKMMADSPAYQKVERWRKRYGTGWVVFLVSCVPLLPFDFAALATGMVRYHFLKFLFFATLGRTLRFLVLILLTVEIVKRLFG